jgi:hypothetical protein
MLAAYAPDPAGALVIADDMSTDSPHSWSVA